MLQIGTDVIVVMIFDSVYQSVVLIISDYLKDDTNVGTRNIQNFRNTSTQRTILISTIPQFGVNMKAVALPLTVVLITLIPNNRLTIKARLTYIWNHLLERTLTSRLAKVSPTACTGFNIHLPFLNTNCIFLGFKGAEWYQYVNISSHVELDFDLCVEYLPPTFSNSLNRNYICYV